MQEEQTTKKIIVYAYELVEDKGPVPKLTLLQSM